MSAPVQHSWWSDIPAHINPYILEVGSFRIGWYGMMYVLAFVTVYLLSRYRIKNEGAHYSAQIVEDYIFWAAVGLVLGARIGYVFFYNFRYYSSHPIEAFLPFEFVGGGFRYTGIAGMSYHGGLIGVIVASMLYFRRHKIVFWDFADFISPSIPLGYTFGRLGNFINGELYGRTTTMPWGMYFPFDPGHELRHPSQLYEAFFEGIVLFAILWGARRIRPFSGFHLAAYLAGYGFIRFILEFFREPDTHIGFVLGSFSMGQVLCLIMMLAGLGIALFRRGDRRAVQ